ncbi:hypothetical protein [Nibrella saemangeumensis]
MNNYDNGSFYLKFVNNVMMIKISTLRFILISLFAISLFMVHRLLFQDTGLFASHFNIGASLGSGAAISFSAVAGVSLVLLLIMTPPESKEEHKP